MTPITNGADPLIREHPFLAGLSAHLYALFYEWGPLAASLLNR